MNILTEQEFLNKKQSDTLVVFGSGYSINEITEEQWSKLAEFDSIAFNWFCKSFVPTTFYMIREQSNNKKRRSEGEQVADLVHMLNTEPYEDSCLIVLDMSNSPHPCYKWWENKSLDQFPHEGIVVKDLRRFDIEEFRLNIFEHGVIHGHTTLYNVMHIAAFMGYKRIIFAGIDLYDSRYFWLKEDEDRHTLVHKGLTHSSKHSVLTRMGPLMKTFKQVFPNIELYTFNPKSLLKSWMPIWS